MKVLLTTHQFFPDYTAGTEVLTLSVARSLRNLGHEVYVFTGYPTGSAMLDELRLDEYEFDGIRVFRFHHAYTPMAGQSSLLEVGYDSYLGAEFFDRIIAQIKPDLVHFFHLNRLGSRLVECVCRAGIPSFMTPTDFWMICPTGQLLLGDGRLCTGPSAYSGNCLKHFAQSREQGLVGRAARYLPTKLADFFVYATKTGALSCYPNHIEVVALANRLKLNVSRLNKLNGIAAPTDFMRRLLIKYGVAKEKIDVVSFGIDVVKPAEARLHYCRSRPLRVAFIGTLAPHKGAHILIDAFNRLPGGAAELKLYGRTDDFPDYIRRLESSVGSDRSFDFCGVFPNSEISKIIADVDVLVVPSLWYENTPLVVHSAQSGRCPVIASDLPGLSEVISHDDNGLLFKPGDPTDLARQLQRIICEDGLLDKLSAHARMPKSIEVYVDELLTLWRSST